MENPKFSLVVWTRDTNEVFFRDFMESVVAQLYNNWELYVIDEGQGDYIRRITAEFFPEDERVHYRQLKTSKGKAYAYNIGFHFVLTDAARRGEKEGYLVVADQHDRLSPNTFLAMAESAATSPDVIYTDHDELVGTERMHPHFKPEYNKELLLHRNYIGEFVAVSYGAARQVGEFQEKLREAVVYDYLLRLGDKKRTVVRVPSLLYHRRVSLPENLKKANRKKEELLTEQMLVASAALRRRGIEATVERGTDDSYWKVTYFGKDVLNHESEYLILRNPKVRPLTRNNLEKMYGLLRQKDVAVVGARFIKQGFAIDNCGYIFDSEGISYPAFYGQKIYRATYEQLASIPRDVSMVDSGYCMMDAKIYRKLGGFDPKLSGRDVMLDFCLRAREHGFRTLVEPAVIARNMVKENESSQTSNQRLMERWGEVIAGGDPYYNPNLPMGLENYSNVN